MGNKNRKNNNGKLETSGNNDNTGIKLASAINDIVSGFSALLLGDPTQPLNAVKKGADDHLFGMISDIRDKLNGKQDTNGSSAPSNSKGVEYSPSWLAELFDSLSSVDKETVKKLQIVKQALAPDGAIVGIVNNLVSLEPQLQVLSAKNISIVDLFENTLDPLLKFNEQFAKASGENDIIFGVIEGLATELSSMKQVLDIFANLEIPNNIDEEDIDKIVDIIKGGIRIVDAITKTDDGKPRNLSEQLKDIDKSEPQLEKLVTFVRSFNMIMTALSKTEVVSEEVVESAVGKMDAVVRFINKLSEIDSQALDNLNSIIDSVEKIEQCIIGMGAIMLLASFVGSYIDLGSIVKFAINFTVFVTLCYGAWMFINGIMSIFSSLGGKKKKEDDNTKKALHRFGVDDYATDSGFDALDAFNRIVVTSALVMLFASFVGKFLKIDKILEFTTLLGAFMLLVVTPYMILMPHIKDVQGVAAELSLLVLVSVGIMLIGAMLVVNFPQLILGSLMFGLVLGTFIFLISAAYRVGGGGAESILDGKDKTIKKADGLANVVMKSALALILGPLAIRWAKLEYWKDIIPFAVVLGLFIAAINLSLSFMNPKALRSAGQLSLLIVICASALTLGPILLKKANIELKEVLFFGLIVSGFILLMVLAVHLLSKNIKNVGLGILAMIGLAITLTAFVYITKMIADLGNQYGWLEILDGFGKVLTVMGILTLIVATIGAFTPLVVAGLLGAAVVGAVALAVSTMCDTIKKIYATSEELNGKELNIEPFIQFGKGIENLTKELWPLMFLFPVMLTISSSIIMMSLSLYTIADVIIDFASATIPVYKNGKKVGQRQITERDYSMAGESITKLLTFFTGLITKVWDENKESGLFDTGGGLFAQITGQTKFSQIARSFTSISTLMSNMAGAISDISNLKIPIYDPNSSTPKGYRSITGQDFVNAATNVASVISILGATIMAFANGQNSISVNVKGQNTKIDLGNAINEDLSREMFGTLWTPEGIFFGQTKFSRTLGSISKLGNLISDIAGGIKDMAQLTMPIYKNGKKTGEKTLDTADFVNAATNVASVISILGATIMALGDGQNSISITVNGQNTQIDLGDMIDKKLADEMFGTLWTPTGILFGQTKFSRTLGSVYKLGNLISDIAGGIKDMAHLTMPIYKNGKKTGEKSLDTKDFTNAATNVASVISILGATIMALGGGNSKINIKINGESSLIDLGPAINKDLADEMFGAENAIDWFTGNTRFGRIIGSVSKLGNLISDIASGISIMAKSEFPTYETNSTSNIISKTSKTQKLDKHDYQNAAESISTVITIMAATMLSLSSGKSIKMPGEITIGIENSELANMFKEDDTLDQIMRSGLLGPFGFIGSALGLGKSESPLAKILRIISPIGMLISSLADGIVKFAEGKFPELDEKGKPTGNMQPINDTIIKSLGENVSKIVVGLLNALIDATSNPNFENAKKALEGDAMKNLMESTLSAINIVSNSVNLIQYLGAGLYPKTEKDGSITFVKLSGNWEKSLKDNTYKIISSLLGAVREVIMSISGNAELSTILNSENNQIEKIFSGISSISESLTDVIKNITDLLDSDAFNKISNNKQLIDKETKIQQLFEGTKRIIISILSNMSELQYLFRIDTFVAPEVMKQLYSEYNNILNDRNKKALTSWTFNEFQNFAENLNEQFTIITNALSTIQNINNETNTYIDTLKKINIGKLTESISGIKNVISIIADDKIIANVDKHILQNSIDTMDMTNKIMNIFKDIISFNSTSTIQNTNTLISSFESFIDFVKSTSDDTIYFESFDENTDIIDRYVKTINSIDVVKIKSFTDSIKAMNELSSKLGSLDKLSEAISKKLAMAIAYLATKLDESGTQIRMASTIHTQRAKTISSAIDKITKIMSSHFIVDVYNASPTNPGNPTVKPESLGNGELTETDLGNRSDVESLDWGTDDISGLSNLKKNMTIGEIRELIKKNTKFNQKEIQLIEKALSRYYTTF